MEVNENTVLQNGKVEDEYVRIGTTLFRILNQPMMNGSFRKMRVEWKMSVFRQDHSKDEAAQIPKYDGFCTMPSHTDYRHNVNNFYNLYEPITHIPIYRQKGISNISVLWWNISLESSMSWGWTTFNCYI